MRVGEILRALRRKHNLTMENMAEELELAYSTYQSYENEGSGKIQVSTLDQIARYYKMTLGELINYQDDVLVKEQESTYGKSPAIQEQTAMSLVNAMSRLTSAIESHATAIRESQSHTPA